MRERKYVKFRVDMYNDTKFKIIDRMPRRDLIHYVWSRGVVLAGKVNREGDLYMSKNIPFTVETLAIEFNREIDEIRAALDILVELEMIEFIDNKIYRVKNFAKHQNIKVEPKEEPKAEENDMKNPKTNLKGNKAQVKESLNKVIYKDENEADKNQARKNNIVQLEDKSISDLDIGDKEVNKANVDIGTEKLDTNQHIDKTVNFEMKKSQKPNKKRKKASKKKTGEDIIGIDGDNLINIMGDTEEELCCFNDGEDISLREGEKVVSQWKF